MNNTLTKIINDSSQKKSVYLTGNNLIANLSELVKKYVNFEKIILLTDKNIYHLAGQTVVEELEKLDKNLIKIFINKKESGKNMRDLKNLITKILSHKINRNSTLIALGGGSITDCAGFLASILLRGIKCVFIPTTLLAMVDAAIGGKNGMNVTLDNKIIKNMVGTFYQPDLVISDVNLLKTLPDTEIRNGMGEIVKYYIAFSKPDISVIPSAVEESRANARLLINLISQCQKIKLAIVKQDPFDNQGIREVLNLGHTVGHALESVGEGRFSHGEAVSVGICAIAKVSQQMNLLSEVNKNKIISLISSVGLPVKAQALDPDEILSALEFDKKDGRLILIKDIGQVIIRDDIPLSVIKSVIQEITL
ncbi:hypothetical protein A3D78_07760 [Candidatus Gottesmanbacteria bacterium RIFCSPHIGHO2_02_FULL_39_14]|uniref:Uncharacterized protein n=1 Tax=Candidatus Gottesmanbacteria bacterium RIFCSPHIGHO2_02_FULL_39_14 TaxID=1798383 RepID=A0A1F6A2T9_9BACT|nr:MAG: hypothetical protein A3D78_07760 [Candidatus Gottesmanbacteria bacterium RIFCSPHIGHO2_02_FULL_39_14]